MCGFGWFVAALPWTIIGLVWIYMLIWMFILDQVKLAVNRKLNRRSIVVPPGMNVF